MRYTSRNTLITLALALLLSVGAMAQTRYVSDELRINMRTGQGDQYRITKIVPSGTKMTVLDQGEDGEWIQVRTEAGDQGWVRAQYLQNEPVARDRLAEARERIARAASLEEENRELSSALQAARAEADRLSAELEELERISSNAVDLNQTNQQLMEERSLLETELDVLQAENERLSDNSNQTWFLYGAIAVGIGVLMTLLAQNIRSRRRYSEWA